MFDWPQYLLERLPSALPTSCALCGGACPAALCDACSDRHAGSGLGRCSCCAIPLPASSETSPQQCGECLKHPPAFDATVVAVDYAPPVDQLVLALKFGSRLELASLLARMLMDTSRDIRLPTCLTAVPLGPRRLVERGFNQSLEIAKPLSRLLGVRLDAGIVVRLRDTHAQALLHPDERQRNIRKAFVVPADAIDRIRGRHIGVVDDVMTTGQTLNEVAATFKRFGAARVTNFVFARTSPR